MGHILEGPVWRVQWDDGDVSDHHQGELEIYAPIEHACGCLSHLVKILDNGDREYKTLHDQSCRDLS